MFLKAKRLFLAGLFPLFVASAWAAGVTFGTLGNGGAFNTSTDQILTVRNGGGAGHPDVLTKPACASLSDATASCSTDATNASNISSGTLGSAEGGAGTISGALKGNGAGVVSQAACADLSNGGTACAANTGTGGAVVPLLNGNNTQSGTTLFTGGVPVLANGKASVAASATKGGIFTGQGAVDDIDLQNSAGADVCLVATGTTNLNCTGLQVGGNAVLTGNQTITLSGDTTGSGATSITTTTGKVNGVSYPSAPSTHTVPVITASNTATYKSVPDCQDSTGNHLNYTQSTDSFSCGTTDSHVGTVTSVATTAPLAGGTITSTGTLSITGAAGQVLAGSTPAFTATPTLGVNASTTGQLGLASGAGSGATVTVQNRSATGAYNFNLPATAGGAGQILTSQGGGTNDMTWASDNVGGGMFNYSDNGVTVTANTYYTPIGGGGIPQTTEANVDVPSPSATTVTNLQVGVSAAPGVGNSYTITLRDAGADTALTCQISGGSATTCSDLTHSVNVAQNDLIDWKFVSAGTIVTTPTVTISANNGTSNVGVTSIATNNGITGGTITTTGTIGLASVSNNSVLCNNTGGSAVPTAANCTVTGTGNAVLAASPTVSGTLTAANVTATGNIYANGGYIESGAAYTANTGASYALQIDNGPKQVITITGAVTITLATPTHFGSATFVLKQDGSGHVYSITGCKWPGGTAITYSTAASALDVVSVLYDGTNYYCMGGAAFS